MNQVIWVDEHDNELGIISRKEAHAKGLRDRIVVVFLVNPDGQILVTQRAKGGRLDHSAAGHVDPGEDYLTAAKRELKEELGIEVELIELGKVISNEIDSESNYRTIRHAFKVYECHAEPGELAKDEVKSVFWADPKEIWFKMQYDPQNEVYCGGFKASLEFYLKNKGFI